MNKTYGQIAYDAYCEARNWKSFNNDPLPSFAQMRKQNPEIADAWEKAGEAVSQAIGIVTGRG
jgi:hypothetical protein